MKRIPTTIVHLFPIDSADKVKALLSALQAELVASNADLRALKTSKALHRIAASMQCASWSEFLAKLTRHQFETTLQQVYGLSDTYADAAYQSLTNTSRMSGDGVAVAHNYCRQFKIHPVNALPENEVTSGALQGDKNTPYGQDPHQVLRAQSALTELCEQIEQGDTPEIYGIGSVFEISLILSSSCSAHLTIDPYSAEIIKGQVREKGFAVGTAEMTPHQRNLIAKHFEQEIKEAILELQESR